MMPASVDFPIIGINARLPQDTPERTINWYAEKDGSVLTVKPTPGSRFAFQFAINGGGRGLNNTTGRLFGVRGAFFQEIVDGVPIVRGTLLTTINPVAIVTCLPPNGEGQVLIVDDSHGYVYKFSDNSFTTLTELGNGFLGGGSQAVFCAGVAVVFKPGTTQFQCSNLYDFTVWDGTANDTCQSLNTPLSALASNGNLVYLFSNDGFEVWEDMGYAVFPFSRVIAGDRIGCLAPFSVFVFKRYVYWLASNQQGQGQFYRHIAGSSPERISDNPTERILAETENLSQCVSYCYESLGHDFYVNMFIDGNLTIVKDSITGLWHERQWRDPATNEAHVVPYIAVVFFDNELFGLSYIDGKVYVIDNEAFTDNGNPISRSRITMVIPPESDWMNYYQSVELFGQISNTPAGQLDPNIMLQYSTDRGMTWSEEIWAQAGGIGTYAARTKWTGLGSAFGIVFKFTIVAAQYVSWRSFRVRMVQNEGT